MDNKEDKILLSRVEDRIAQCERRYMITHTGFLDLRQRSLVEDMLRFRAGVRYGFYGGYEDAERVVGVFLPDYIAEETAPEHFAAEPEDNPLKVVRLSLKKGSEGLTHRDYLGSLMGLGIEREMTGDILVREDGADVLVLDEIAEYVVMNLSKVGRFHLDAAAFPVQELKIPEQQREERQVSVASLRTDNVVSAAFGLSRTKAADAIRAGLVFVNGLEVKKTDHMLSEGDKLVLRHKGKTVIQSVGGKSARGRTHVTLLRYK